MVSEIVYCYFFFQGLFDFFVRIDMDIHFKRKIKGIKET